MFASRRQMTIKGHPDLCATKAVVRLTDRQNLAVDGDDLPRPRLRGQLRFVRAVQRPDPVHVVPRPEGGTAEPAQVGHFPTGDQREMRWPPVRLASQGSRRLRDQGPTTAPPLRHVASASPNLNQTLVLARLAQVLVPSRQLPDNKDRSLPKTSSPNTPIKDNFV
jgi:hypothetical protein